jgi:hypothetical protein
VLSSDLLVRYEYELKTLILELFNPDIDITEKEV